MGRLHILSFLSILIGPIYAQLTYPNCSAGWDWMYNSLNQNPCNVAAYLEGSCNGGQFDMPLLSSGSMYGGPTGAQNNPCECNTVVYSLVSACAACQGSSWIPWSGWSANCTNISSPSTYPNPIPDGTRVPHWAYLDTEASNSWNITAAQSAGDSPEAGPTETSSPTPSPNSKQDTSHRREIAGATVGAVASATLLTAVVVWYLRCRRWRASAEPQPSPFTSSAQVFGLQDNCTSTSIGRYYDPSDPSTFPKPLVSPPATASQTTSSSERACTINSIRPPDRSVYPGLPLV